MNDIVPLADVLNEPIYQNGMNGKAVSLFALRNIKYLKDNVINEIGFDRGVASNLMQMALLSLVVMERDSNPSSMSVQISGANSDGSASLSGIKVDRPRNELDDFTGPIMFPFRRKHGRVFNDQQLISKVADNNRYNSQRAIESPSAWSQALNNLIVNGISDLGIKAILEYNRYDLVFAVGTYSQHLNDYKDELGDTLPSEGNIPVYGFISMVKIGMFLFGKIAEE